MIRANCSVRMGTSSDLFEPLAGAISNQWVGSAGTVPPDRAELVLSSKESVHRGLASV